MWYFLCCPCQEVVENVNYLQSGVGGWLQLGGPGWQGCDRGSGGVSIGGNCNQATAIEDVEDLVHAVVRSQVHKLVRGL
jgi:hypothetical protein